MPLLHISLTEPNQTINLMHDLKQQTLILRQVMICKDATASMLPAEEGLQIDLHHMFNGFEFLSNKSDDNKSDDKKTNKLMNNNIKVKMLLIELINDLLSNLFLFANRVTIELCNGPLTPPRRTKKKPGRM